MCLDYVFPPYLFVCVHQTEYIRNLYHWGALPTHIGYNVVCGFISEFDKSAVLGGLSLIVAKSMRCYLTQTIRKFPLNTCFTSARGYVWIGSVYNMHATQWIYNFFSNLVCCSTYNITTSAPFTTSPSLPLCGLCLTDRNAAWCHVHQAMNRQELLCEYPELHIVVKILQASHNIAQWARGEDASRLSWL